MKEEFKEEVEKLKKEFEKGGVAIVRFKEGIVTVMPLNVAIGLMEKGRCSILMTARNWNELGKKIKALKMGGEVIK